MKNMYQEMIRYYVKIYSLVFFFLLAALFLQKFLDYPIIGTLLGLCMPGCLILSCFKVFTAQNWLWFRTFPIKRVQLFRFIVAEFLISIAVGAAYFMLVYYFSYLQDSNPMGFFEAIQRVREYIIESIKDNWWLGIPILISISPILFFFMPIGGWNAGRTYGHTITLKQKAGILAFVACVVLAPYIAISVLASGVLSRMAWSALMIIFPTKKFKTIAKVYGCSVFAAVMAICIGWVEFSQDSKTRAALRMDYYGFFAPKLSRSEIFNILADPSISESSRMEIAKFEDSRNQKDKLISEKDLIEWGEKASSSRIYFQGLLLFKSALWTNEALMILENHIQKRCKDGVHRAKWVSVWICELEAGLISDKNYPLDMRFTLKETSETKKMISVDHPVIASLLMQTSIELGRHNWKEQIEILSKNNAPVISDQARMWLDRSNANSEDWYCPSEYRKQGICNELEVITRSGVTFQSAVPNDSGGSISIKVVH